jgi:hypothetical protein
MNQMEVSIQSVYYRPFAPASRNNEGDVIAVLSRFVKEGDTQRVISSERWIRDCDCTFDAG